MSTHGTAETVDLASLAPGKRLRIRRLLAGVTQHELAERLGTWAARISEAERDGERVAPHVGRLRAQMDEALARLQQERQAVSA